MAGPTSATAKDQLRGLADGGRSERESYECLESSLNGVHHLLSDCLPRCLDCGNLSLDDVECGDGQERFWVVGVVLLLGRRTW